MSAGEIEVEIRIEAPPETVFAYFVDPERYRRWKGSAARLDPRPGGEYAVDLAFGSGPRGRYVVVEPPSRLVFTWGWDGPVELQPGLREVAPGSSTVEVTFVQDGDATIVRLRHGDLPTEEARSSHGWGWTLYLGRLALAATGGDPGPDPLPALIASHPERRPWRA